ncbi:MAG: glutaredoxin, partial [Pseudomonas sp.]
MPAHSATKNSTQSGKTQQATLYRMVMDKHLCPFGLKSLDLLKREGYSVDDNWLTSREETDAFKARHDVETTPQTFIGEKRVGGYDELRRHFGKKVKSADETSYQPVLAVFGVAALLALAVSWMLGSALLTIRSAELFIAFSMCILALLKLQDLESFSTMFLNYDLLAQRVVRYGYAYPF